jgi:hypothetical protein
VTLLLARGAEIEARLDFKANALESAVVGSGEQRSSAAAPDRGAVVRILLDAGSSTDGDRLRRRRPQAAESRGHELLRARGVISRT